MNWRVYVRERLPHVETSPERELEIVEELAAQLESAYQRAIAGGATHQAALRSVEAEVPDWENLARTLTRIEGPPRAIAPPACQPAPFVSTFADDLRYALRSTLAWRGLPAALSMLALSTASVLTVSAGVDSWLFDRPAMARPDRLAVVWGTNLAIGQARDVVSGPTFLDLQRRSRTIAGMAAFAQGDMTIRSEDRAEAIGTLAVTPEFFDVLGVQAEAGRTFQGADLAAPGGVAMISHRAWRTRFGGDPSIAGRTLARFGQPHVIVGVLPPDFHLLSSPDVVTLLDPRALEKEDRSHYYYWIVARLAEGRTFGEAGRELDAIMEALASEHAGMRGWTATVEPLYRTLAEPVRPALAVLFGTALLVLVIGAANTTNLVVSRAMDKRHDLAIRSALGATGARLRRQWLIEGALISTAGTAAGLSLAAAAVHAADRVAPRSAAIAGSAATVELPALALGPSAAPAAMLMALLLTIVLGVLAFRRTAPGDLISARRTSSASAGLSRGRQLLLAAQTAIATVLLAVAGLLLVLVVQLMTTSPGFDGSHVLAMIVGRVHDLDAAARARYYTSVLRAVAAVPGVTSVALNDYVPLTNEDDYEGLEIPGRPPEGSGQLPREEWRRVSAGFFRTMRIPLIRGRAFSDADDERAASVVVINETLARKYFADADPIGRRVRITSQPYGWSEIVGMVGDVREAGLDRPAKPMMFVPYHRDPRPVMGLFVSLPDESETMTRAISEAVSSIDAGRPVFEARSMNRIVADSYAIQRSTLWMAAALASLALLLMLGGTYAVVNLAAASRTPEIAVRVALGARRGDVLRAVLGPPCLAAGGGLAVGLAGAAVASRALASLVGGVPPLDWSVIAGVMAPVGLAVAAACLAPARRVLGVDAAAALRGE